MKMIYSPLRYPGGKSRFYLYVRNLMELNGLLGETYIEPFAGGAGLALCLLLNDDVKRIVINDLDPAIYAFWHSILNHTEQFCDLIVSTDITTDEWVTQRAIYLECDISDLFKLGFATFFLNRTNVSGVITGGIIGGKEQKGKYKIDARFNKGALIARILEIARRRDQIVVSNEDAKDFLTPKKLRRFYKVFINLDPPYVKKGSLLYKNSFNEKDHRDLHRLLKYCNRKWIVTYDICNLIDCLYKTYRSSYLDVTYSIQEIKNAKEYIFFSNNMELPDSLVLRPVDNDIIE